MRINKKALIQKSVMKKNIGLLKICMNPILSTPQIHFTGKSYIHHRALLLIPHKFIFKCIFMSGPRITTYLIKTLHVANDFLYNSS